MAIKKSNIHFVHTIHNVAHKETSSPYLQRLNKWLFRTKRVVPVTISEECRKSYVELYNLTSPACINNGTPKMEKSYFFDSVGEEIKQLKHTPYSKILIHVGRFNEQKNHGMMINTINRLVNNGTDIELIIIGGGFESEKGKKLQAYACDRIHFLGTKSNVGDYMLHSDYFIMSSLWEGLPISIIESMSIGLPVISTPAGGIPNVITDGYTGFLSHDFSEEDFFNTISHALYTKLDPMEIYNEYRAHFSMDACASAYLSLYQNI